MRRDETPGAKVKSKAGKHRKIKRADYPVCPRCGTNKHVVWYTEHEYRQHKKGRHKGFWYWRVQFRGFICWHKTKGKKCWYHIIPEQRQRGKNSVCVDCGKPERYKNRSRCHECYKRYDRLQTILRKKTKISKILKNLG